jgi:hypothetical protein
LEGPKSAAAASAELAEEVAIAPVTIIIIKDSRVVFEALNRMRVID